MSLCLQQRLRVCFKSYDEGLQFLWGCDFISFGLVRCHPSGWWDSRPYEHIRVFALNLVACITTIFNLAFLHQIPLGSTLLRWSHPCFAKLYTSAPTERCEWYMQDGFGMCEVGRMVKMEKGPAGQRYGGRKSVVGTNNHENQRCPLLSMPPLPGNKALSRDDWPWYHAEKSLKKKALISFNLDPLETSDCGTQLSGAEEPTTQLLQGWSVGLAGGSFTWQVMERSVDSWCSLIAWWHHCLVAWLPSKICIKSVVKLFWCYIHMLPLI